MYLEQKQSVLESCLLLLCKHKRGFRSSKVEPVVKSELSVFIWKFVRVEIMLWNIENKGIFKTVILILTKLDSTKLIFFIDFLPKCKYSHVAMKKDNHSQYC